MNKQLFTAEQVQRYSLNQQIELLGAIRDAESDLYQRIHARAEAHRKANPLDAKGLPISEPEDEKAYLLTDEEKRQLRLDSVAQLAELLYLFEVSGIKNDAERLRGWLMRHNEDIASLKLRAAQKDPELKARKLSPQRLERGILSKEQIEAMVEEAGDQGLRFDQTSLAALLIESMSPESTRTLIQLMARCGFLTRVRRAAASIRSTGKLEQCFQIYLCTILNEIGATSILANAVALKDAE